VARRKGFFAKLADTLKKAWDATPTPAHRERDIKREARRYAQGHRVPAKAARRYAEQRYDAEVTKKANAARKRAAKRAADPWEGPWRQEMPGKRINRREFEGHKTTFQSIPGMEEESDADLKRLWRSYIRNMVYGQSGYKFQDPRNPFWDDIGMHPENFDWSEWRRWRKTP
jgi:hypothetical protein